MPIFGEIAVRPLPHALARKLSNAGATSITIYLEGGNDEGYVSSCVFFKDTAKKDDDLSKEVQEWADAVYVFSGAGGGDAYGCDIDYDLENGVVEFQDWQTVRDYGDAGESEIEVTIPGEEDTDE